MLSYPMEVAQQAGDQARLLRAIIKHWNEFGPEHGFAELVDQAEKAQNQPRRRDGQRRQHVAVGRPADMEQRSGADRRKS